ncbi:hypothetical protein SO802_020812 [Lithocarpus litseifolius]|uniref:Uncharacterized protein n=1 Tax=Lithocarpus litseifolius TaxID=425828 RepID=A0AAW2CD53_9ROSI
MTTNNNNRDEPRTTAFERQRNGYAKGMLGPTVMEWSKRTLALKKGTEKDQKAAMP